MTSESATGYWDAETSAENTQATATAQANAAWWSAGYVATTTALDTMATTLSATSAAGWAQFESQLASAKQSWWGNATSGADKDYLDNAAAVNDQYTAYQGNVDTAYLTEVGTKTGADVAYATSTSNADVGYATDMANADEHDVEGYGSSIGTATATMNYLDAVALAEDIMPRTPPTARATPIFSTRTP